MPNARPRWSLAFLLLQAPWLLRCGGDDGGGPPKDDGEGGDASAGTSGKGGSSGAGRGGSGGSGGKASGDAGTGSTEMLCVPGETQECVGPGACRGGQACRADGSGFTACDCGGGSGGSAGAPANGGEGGSSDTGNAGESGAPAAGGAGDGGQGGAGNVACDPVRQTGCEPGQKCTSVQTEEPGLSVAGCVPDGENDIDQPCTRTDDVDDCTAGNICIAPPGGGTNLRCRPFCDPSDVNTCDGSCGLYEGLFPNDEAGVCEPRCDLLDPQCEPELMCVFAANSPPFCARGPSSTPLKTLGESCTFANECEAGLGCIYESFGSANEVCGFLCDAMAGRGPYCNDAGGPGVDAACVPLDSLYETSSHADAGVCIDCATAGFASCALLLPGGCIEEGDCDPLTGDLGLAFECDTLGQRCILSP